MYYVYHPRRFSTVVRRFRSNQGRPPVGGSRDRQHANYRPRSPLPVRAVGALHPDRGGGLCPSRVARVDRSVGFILNKPVMSICSVRELVRTCWYTGGDQTGGVLDVAKLV